MDRHAAVLVLIVISMGVSGCSNERGNGTDSWPPPNSKALDREVVALKPGMSLESVQARLGEPQSDRKFGGEPGVQMLFYDRWQLLFEDGHLARRIKYVFERPFPDPSTVDQKEKAFDRRVLDLKRGASISAIRSKFGPPDTYEIIRTVPRREEILAYELWELTFVDGALNHRQKR